MVRFHPLAWWVGNMTKASDIIFIEVNNKETKKQYRDIINTYHKYKDWKDYVGRRIGWIITLDNEVIGVIGIASAPMNIGARDKWIGWTKEQKLKNLNKIATNYRFCMIKEGLGSQVLSRLSYYAKERWASKYGDKLVLLDTMVKPPFTGTVYKAANWTYVGMTKGIHITRPPSKSLLSKELDGSAGKNHAERAKLVNEKGWKEATKKVDYWNFKSEPTEQKYIYVRPLHSYWKKELLRL